jgi:hypothetical protein
MPEEISVNEITCFINTLSIIISLSSIAISYATYHKNKQRGQTMKCPDCLSKQDMIKTVDEDENKVYLCTKCGCTIPRGS